MLSASNGASKSNTEPSEGFSFDYSAVLFYVDKLEDGFTFSLSEVFTHLFLHDDECCVCNIFRGHDHRNLWPILTVLTVPLYSFNSTYVKIYNMYIFSSRGEIGE